MSTKIRWGLLAAGAIAKAFAKGVNTSQTGELSAVAARNPDKARAFADQHGIPKSHGSYAALLADPEVDAVYISTPHPLHTEWAIKAAEAGKHILCEKPMSINAFETQSIVEAAEVNGVFLMEAYMYRCNPLTEKLLSLLREGAIGKVRVVKATFSFGTSFGTTGRLWEQQLAGGGILDVGGYTTSYACMVAGAVQGTTFAVPTEVKGVGVLGPDTGIDGIASALLKFDNGILAECSAGIAIGQENCVQIFGSDGRIKVPSPYMANREASETGTIEIKRKGSDQMERIPVDASDTSFTYEADVCGRAILAGHTQAPPPAMTWRDSIENARVQDAWRREIGLVYDREQPENMPSVTYAGRRLEHRKPLMNPGTIQFLDKPVSRLVMGVDNQTTSPHAQAVFDHYFEHGGNAFDTGYVYGKVKSQLLGSWMRARGVRNDVVVVAKGAHTPYCNPESLTGQLLEQLDWLDTETVDIYLLHRDNPEIPVGEFMDVLNLHRDAGRIKTFGASNWSLERIGEANAYAEEKGLQPMSVVSNNLSLAVMEDPVWAGCVHVHDDASLAWLEERQLTLLPWSSQARGFFLPDRARPDLREDEQLVRCWYSKANFERQRRAVELAETHGVDAINISLAWVLGRPFPVFALIGPRTLGETRSSLRALEIALTPEEMAYLDLKTP